jgi:N-carbamoyl-L-amino-acid hydrolase
VARHASGEQLGLIRAHPNWQANCGQLTAESTSEQAKSGLHLCSPENSPRCTS